MIAIRLILVIAALVLASGSRADAQENTKPPAKPLTTMDNKPIVQVNVTVVFTEYEGDRKLGSLPYTLQLSAQDPPGSQRTLRNVIKVPITTSAQSGQFQYLDVGVKIDGRGLIRSDGRYELDLFFERSSIYLTGQGGKGAMWTGVEAVSSQPILSEFRGSATLLLRDGQSTQAMTATDPVSGRVQKVDVTLNVLK